MQTHSAAKSLGLPGSLAWPGCHVASRYVKRASSLDITFQWCGLRWAMHTKRNHCPPAAASTTAQNTCLAKTLSLESGCTHTHTQSSRGQPTSISTKARFQRPGNPVSFPPAFWPAESCLTSWAAPRILGWRRFRKEGGSNGLRRLRVGRVCRWQM